LRLPDACFLPGEAAECSLRQEMLTDFDARFAGDGTEMKRTNFRGCAQRRTAYAPVFPEI
jgi:hypothetical protein